MTIEKKLANLAVTRSIFLSLDNMRAAVERLGHPEASLRFIHVAGTNGKGTTCDFIAQLLEKSGYKIGAYFSPHFISYCERFLINGKPITSSKLNHYFTHLEQKLGDLELTEFELLTLIALLYFRDEKADYVVWETGLGGRLDASNIVTPVASVITTLSMDHRNFLGDTLAQIAGEKAGIIKEGVPVFMHQAVPEAQQVIANTANRFHAPLTVISQAAADYLEQNKVLALAVVTFLLPKKKSQLVQMAPLLQTRLPGRLQVLCTSPLLLIDSAHNFEGISRLVDHIRQHYGKMVIVYGATDRPDLNQILEKISSVSQEFYLCEFDHPRAVKLERFATLLPDNCYEPVPAKKLKSLLLRLLSEPKLQICITGSIYFLGEVMKRLPARLKARIAAPGH